MILNQNTMKSIMNRLFLNHPLVLRRALSSFWELMNNSIMAGVRCDPIRLVDIVLSLCLTALICAGLILCEKLVCFVIQPVGECSRLIMSVCDLWLYDVPGTYITFFCFLPKMGGVESYFVNHNPGVDPHQSSFSIPVDGTVGTSTMNPIWDHSSLLMFSFKICSLGWYGVHKLPCLAWDGAGRLD